MFVLRIAGDVQGHKRNIEVTFPHRPSLQQVCTVAETLLPLTIGDDRQPWRPPGALSGSALTSSRALSFDRRAAAASDYAVDAVVVLNPSTQEWEQVDSATQLCSGAQVYCFSPLQQHRVVMVASPQEVARGALPPHLPVVTDVHDRLVNTDRPGAIPPPQQRLAWDCVTASRSPTDGSVGPQREASVAQDNSRNLGSTLMEPWEEGPSGRPLSAMDSPSVLRPGSFSHGRSAQRDGRRQHQEPYQEANSFVDFFRDSRNSSRLAFTPQAHQSSHSARVKLAANSPSTARDTSLGSRLRNDWRSAEMSAAAAAPPTERGIGDATTALLLSGEGGNRYAHLGERLSLLFDVLVHLDTQEAGVRRQYLLLRDFYLFASFVATAAARSTAQGGTAVSPLAEDLTAALASRFHWSWDDLLRTADRDRDGCVAYREWVAFGIEHPDVIQLLCRSVQHLPAQVTAALRRLRASGQPASHAASRASPPAQAQEASREGSAMDEAVSGGDAVFPCRIHGGGGSGGGPRFGSSGWRCEACRELAAQSPDERRWLSTAPKTFTKMLRR